jgi:hypothetical protein
MSNKQHRLSRHKERSLAGEIVFHETSQCFENAPYNGNLLVILRRLNNITSERLVSIHKRDCSTSFRRTRGKVTKKDDVKAGDENLCIFILVPKKPKVNITKTIITLGILHSKMETLQLRKSKTERWKLKTEAQRSIEHVIEIIL